MIELRTDISAEDYHRHEALSASGARKLLPPSCPARFRWEQDHPQPSNKVFEEGHAAHALALGTGPELVLVDRERWDTNAVKAEVAEIRARGAVPLKRDQFEMVHAMAKALRDNPLAAALLRPGTGQAEASLFWTDLATGVELRARLDWLPEPADGRLIIPDYKTTRSADPDKFAKSALDYGYYQQAAWYLDGIAALRTIEDAAFVFIAQEKEPPYLVTVAEADGLALRHGRDKNREAIEIFAECQSTGVWPAYTDEVAVLSLPPWLENQYLREIA